MRSRAVYQAVRRHNDGRQQLDENLDAHGHTYVEPRTEAYDLTNTSG